MIHIGHSTYLPKGKLERLNTPLAKSNYLPNLYNILNEALNLMEKGEYDQEKFASKFPGKQYLKRTDLTKQLKIFCQIEPDIWFRLQTIMVKYTGHVWPMDIWVDFIMGWFICTYHEMNKEDLSPPIKLRNKKPKRFKLLYKFNKTFSMYYKNMMGEWN